ncbi:MAG TPA: DUF5671 domain-containing protein [Candidatus Dormibacteraeota bacterium]|nr:DUF5671 domain-containing protein [Candidatus Dormibacteraeota bacterium]
MSAVIALAAVLLLIGGVVVVVLAIRQGRLDTSPRALLRFYLYALAFASFLVLLFGATSLVKAGMATVAGRGFSYYEVSYQYGPPGAPPVKPGVVPVPPPVPTDQSERPYRDDLVRGLALVVTGGLLWVLHWLGIRALDPPEVRRTSLLAALYSGGLLAIAGLVTVVALPWGIYSVLAYYVLPQDGNGPSNRPGDPLSYAIVFLPVLLYFLWRLIERARGPRVVAKAA